MDDRYPLSLPLVSCPSLKHLLEYEPEEINKAFHCCGGTRLHHLVSNGLGEEVLQLLNKGADVNLIDSDGQTALIVAITKKSISPDIVKIIAQKTSDLNILNREGRNSLHLAVSSANYEAVQILLQLGANIDFQDRLGNSPLHCAFNYSLDLVEKLVENGANVGVKNKNGETPLHIAVRVYKMGLMGYKQLTNVISILLDKGSNINEQTKDGKTILHILEFCWLNHPNINEIITFLLSKGAQVHLQDRDGVTPLYLAIKQQQRYLVLMLRTESGKSAVNIPDNKRNYPLFWATEQGDFKMVKLLLDNGAIIDIKNKFDETPLYFALGYGEISEPIFNLLIERGAQVSCKNKYMKTPLHIASYRAFDHRKLICTTLLTKGASPNVQDETGMTPLHYAIESSSKKIVQLLVENGAEVNIKNTTGETPLHVSTRQARDSNTGLQEQICKTLLGKGALPNCQDVYGNTPLHNAAKNFTTHITQLLIENGSELNITNNKGETPLHLSTHRCRVIGWQRLICTNFLNKGASLNVQDATAMTPLHYAVESNSEEIVQLLLENGAEVNSKNKAGKTPLHINTCHIFGKNSGMQDKICTSLLDKEASLNVQDDYGMTPLHNAVLCYNTSLVQLLLEHGADVNITNNKGETPLHLSTRRCRDIGLQELTCSTLIAEGALINVQDKFGMTPLHNAVKGYTTIIVQLLLENGAELNIKNKKGQSPIRYVCNVDTLEVLLQKGAEVNEQDNYGQTALHNIAKDYLKSRSSKASSKVVKLLEWGASQNIRDYLGKLPFDYYSFTDAQKEYEVKRTCLYSTYQMERDRSGSYNFQKLHKSCCEEIDRMKLELLGANSLYDIFRHYDDPIFVSNSELESSVLSKNLKVKFPVYCSMLTSTYLRSKVRVQLFYHVVDILQTPLPFEVMRYILTFVDDDSLKNVIKAKEEPPVKGKTDTASKSDSEPDFELSFENEPDSEYDSDWIYDSDSEYESDWQIDSDSKRGFFNESQLYEYNFLDPEYDISGSD